VSEQEKPSRSLAKIAGIVAVATLVSKAFGLVRQQAIAAVFGVGVAYEAYNFAYVIPGFLLVLLGGINGPFHSAIVSVLAKRKREEAAPLVETISTLVTGGLLLVTIALMLFAEPLLELVAPGLGRTAEGLQIRSIAVQQFRIMAPMALLAGLIGIGFGTLNASNQYWLPSISPLFSSITMLIGLGLLVTVQNGKFNDSKYALIGGLVLAYGTLSGAILQWLVQVPAQWQSGMGSLRLRFDIQQPGVQEILKVMGPATFSSGMMQINVYTDLFFASFIPPAASVLGYAGLLVQTPLGIISNVILVPLLPMLSRLADPNDWDELKLRIRQGLIMTALTMLPLSAVMVTLAGPIVRVVYERGAFKQTASTLVTSVLIAYASGMFAYLGRDVLVRVFYALGDGDTPFRVSVVNIFLNAVMDYVFIFIIPLGAPGLVFSTVTVNVTSMIVLLVLLDRKINGLPWREWSGPFIGLLLGSAVAGGTSWGVLRLGQSILGTEGLMVQFLQLCVAGLAGLGAFALIATQLRLPEVDLFTDRLRQRFTRR